MFDIVDEVSRDLLEAVWDWCPKTLIICKLVFKELLNLKYFGILPFLVSKPFVNPDSFFVITGYLETVLEDRFQSVALEPRSCSSLRVLDRVASWY